MHKVDSTGASERVVVARGDGSVYGWLAGGTVAAKGGRGVWDDGAHASIYGRDERDVSLPMSLVLVVACSLWTGSGHALGSSTSGLVCSIPLSPEMHTSG